MDIETILKQMSLEDKIALCSGENFWETKKYERYGIPSLFMCDGPHGLRKQENVADMLGVNASRKATCFPAEVTTADSWDPELLQKIGSAIGEEAKEQGVGLVLGPGVNLKRNPLCGRSFEYFSEDPYLAGKMAAGFIKGVEEQGVASSLKHFAVNSQEKSRFNSDSVIDERSLRELYLTAFEIAVKEGKPATVMCAYPKLNGVHCSDHKELLSDILRTEWGFDGTVITDWGAMNDRIAGFRAGCDLNMPGGSEYMEKEVLQAVRKGILPESCVNDSARRVLKLVFRASETLQKKVVCNYEEHHALAKIAATEGAVLLKNDDRILPLKENTRIAVVGAMAKNLRYQGAGSSHINPTKLSQPIDFLPNTFFAQGCDDKGNTTDDLLKEAMEVAQKAEIAVVFAGLPDQCESEGFDRENMKMTEGHLRMIDTVAKVNPNTVVVLLSGGVVECPWADCVKGILYMGLPGQAGGEAIADILYGRVNPGGKLAESWPYTYNDVPSSAIYGKTIDALYQEGIYVGYRYYDKSGVAVRWPFGYGLSYTNFTYSDLTVDGNMVSVTVKNTGSMAGTEVVQLYIAAPQDGLHRSLQELKRFQKIRLNPGESQTVRFELSDRCFSVWQGRWEIPRGRYEIRIGNLTIEMEKAGESGGIPKWQSGSWYESCMGKPNQKDWEMMLGHRYIPRILQKGKFTMDNTVMEMKDYSFLMKIMFKAVESTIAKGYGGKKDYGDPNFRMQLASSAGAPLRSMQISGGMKGGVLPGMLEMANGHYLKGIIKMIKG